MYYVAYYINFLFVGLWTSDYIVQRDKLPHRDFLIPDSRPHYYPKSTSLYTHLTTIPAPYSNHNVGLISIAKQFQSLIKRKPKSYRSNLSPIQANGKELINIHLKDIAMDMQNC